MPELSLAPLLSEDQQNSLMDEFLADLRELQAARKAFIASDLFARMRDALLAQPSETFVDSETLAYFPDEARSGAGWHFASDEDMRKFLNIVADPDAVDSAGLTRDNNLSFDNLHFEHFGLHVFMLFGQGTFVRIGNRPLQA